MAEYRVRTADSKDTERILETLRLALGETPVLRRTPELWDWKHHLNPFGRSIVVVAEASDEIVGVRALMRWRLVTPDGTRVSCVRPVDTATHPSFQRRGIFRNLTLTALDIARDEGVDLVFNTPNDKSAPGYLGMGWSEVAALGVQARPRLRRSVRPDANRAPSIEDWAPDFEEARSHPIMANDRPAVGLRTPRDADYLSWRFGKHPTASYGSLTRPGDGILIARAGVRRGRSELVLSELLQSPSPSLVREALRRSRAAYVAGWFSPGSPERGIAIRSGVIPLPMRTLTLVALPLSQIDMNVFDIASWDLSTGDLELL